MTRVKPFDEEERILMEEAEAGLFKPVSKEKRDRIMNIIEENKTKTISIRLNGNDLAKIKEKAESAGLPYQTLINTILHRYISGDILLKTPL